MCIYKKDRYYMALTGCCHFGICHRKAVGRMPFTASHHRCVAAHCSELAGSSGRGSTPPPRSQLRAVSPRDQNRTATMILRELNNLRFVETVRYKISLLSVEKERSCSNRVLDIGVQMIAVIKNNPYDSAAISKSTHFGS
jgi:hypothetical protein